MSQTTSICTSPKGLEGYLMVGSYSSSPKGNMESEQVRVRVVIFSR
jgi:hypothetical protein